MDAGNTKTAERGEKIIGKERYRKYGNEETGRAGKTEEKKIISVVRPQNATSKAKEFTKNQGQKKTVRPAEMAVRKETAMETEEARTVRTVETETAEMEIVRTAMGDRPQGERRFNNNGDRPNRNGDRPQGERRFNNNGDRPEPQRRPSAGENAASAETMETARTAAETVREETAITAEEVETVREAEDHSGERSARPKRRQTGK